MEVEMKHFREGGSLPSGLAWNAKDQVWLCGDEFGTVLKYDEEKDAFERHSACDSTITAISINRNGNICALGFNNSLNLREYPEVGSVVKDTLLRKELPLTCIEFDSTGSLVFVASMQEDVNIHSMEGSTSSQTRINTNGKATRTFSLSPSNEFIGIVDVEGAVKIFSLKIVNNSVESVDLCCEKFDIISKKVSEFGGVGIDFGCKLSWYPDESRRVLLAAPSVEGSIVFLTLDTSSSSAGWSETFLTCDSVSQPSLVFTKGVPLNLVAFSPSGDHLAACDTAGCVVVWSTNATSPADSVPLRRISTAGALPLVDLVWNQKSSGGSSSSSSSNSSSRSEYLLLLGKDTYHRVEGVVRDFLVATTVVHTTVALGRSLKLVSSAPVLWSEPDFYPQVEHHRSVCSQWVVDGLVDSFAMLVAHGKDVLTAVVKSQPSETLLQAIAEKGLRADFVFHIAEDKHSVEEFSFHSVSTVDGASTGTTTTTTTAANETTAVTAASAASAATADVSRSVAAQLRRYSEAIHTQEVLDWLEECPNIRGVFPVVSADNPTQATLLVLVMYFGFRDVTPAAEKLYRFLSLMGYEERESNLYHYSEDCHGKPQAQFSANCDICSFNAEGIASSKATVSLLVARGGNLYGVACGHGMEKGCKVYSPGIYEKKSRAKRLRDPGRPQLGTVLFSSVNESVSLHAGDGKEVMVGIDVSLFRIQHNDDFHIDCHHCCCDDHEYDAEGNLLCIAVGPVMYSAMQTWSDFRSTWPLVLGKTNGCWKMGASSAHTTCTACSDLGIVSRQIQRSDTHSDLVSGRDIVLTSKWLPNQCLVRTDDVNQFVSGDSGSVVYHQSPDGQLLPLALFHTSCQATASKVGIATPFPAVWQQVHKWLDEEAALQEAALQEAAAAAAVQEDRVV